MTAVQERGAGGNLLRDPEGFPRLFMGRRNSLPPFEGRA